MAVMVEDVTTTKSGKGLRVKLSGTWYNAFLDSGLNGQKGKMIEAEIKTHEKYGPYVEAWKPSNAAPQVLTPPVQTGHSPSSVSPAAAAPQYRYAEPNQAPYWLQFASNVVAHAIAAGIIKNPNEVGAWVRAVHMAVSPQQDDQDIPF